MKRKTDKIVGCKTSVAQLQFLHVCLKSAGSGVTGKQQKGRIVACVFRHIL